MLCLIGISFHLLQYKLNHKPKNKKKEKKDPCDFASACAYT